MPKQIKRLLTLDDLVKFCASYGLQKFSASESGYRLSVQIPAPAVFDEEQTDDGLLFVTVKMFHTGKNRNGSYITDEAANKSLSGIKYKPLLANFCEIDGVKDFTSHDMQIVDDDGEYKIEYLERQIGCFTADTPYMLFDDEAQRTYIYAKAAIPREYTDAAEIIERKGGTKVSVELSINEMSYSVSKGAFVFDDFEVMGCTCLGVNPETGEEIKEGMEGASLTIHDFSEENNSLIKNADFEEEKGGQLKLSKFEELLEKYGVTAEEITFEYENLSDEELEKVFEETFGKTENVSDTTEESLEKDFADDENEDDGEDDGETSEETEETVPISDEDEDEETTRKTTNTFELTLSDREWAVWRLVEETYGNEEEYGFCCDVYDDYVVMHSCGDGRYYKQAYSVNDDEVQLEGERVEVYVEYLTAEERAALDLMRSTYDELKQYKDNNEQMIVNTQKDEVFAAFDEKLANNEDYQNLKSNRDNYSVDDITLRCNALVGAETMKFAQTEKKDNKKSSIGFDFAHKPIKKPYGNLFD